MEPKKEEEERRRERKDGKRDQLGRVISKRACQCTVGGTRSPGSTSFIFFSSPFFPSLSRSLLFAFFLFIFPLFPSPIFSRARFGTLILPTFSSSVSFFRACNECAFGKFRERRASTALKFSGHPHWGERGKQDICCISIDDLGAETRRSYCFEKSD